MHRVADSWIPRHGWRSVLLVALALIVAAQASSSAQTPGTPAVTVSPNVNVLRNVSSPLLGDALLQRQNEPVVAVSTRNPDHIMIAANDYRTVDIATDQGIGEVFNRLIRTVTRFTEMVIAKLTRRSGELGESEEEERERAEAGTEAWIGVYVTNDRGRNWTNAWMPGFPQDSSAAGQASPAYGKSAASDPVLVAAPAGRFYLGAMAFDRGGASKVVVSRFTDRNNSENGNNFHFDLMREVDSGPQGKKFLDKPAIAADIARATADPAACGPVYLGYTVFDDKITDPTDRSRILVATSLDCGSTWLTPRKVNKKSKLVQGVTLAIRPSDGRLFAAYRDFETNRIMVTWADDHGYTFAPPVDVSGAMLPFDQPTLGAPDYAFRTNAFPTMTVAGDGSLYVAWQERLAANGNPRIVITSSSPTKFNSWTPKKAVEPTRCVANANGTQTCGVAAGPQVMPSLTFSRGRLMLMFYEARPGVDDVKMVASQNASYITGLDVQLYLRVAQLNASGSGASAIATQFEVDKDGKPLPLITKNGNTEYRGANRPNLPMYAGGKSPFIGDYISIAPSMPFVRASIGAAVTSATGTTSTIDFAANVNTAAAAAKKGAPEPFWRFATEPSDGPTTSFQAAWTDNRDVIFPRSATGIPLINGDWSQYAPPGLGPCINPGARNANVYTAEIAPRLVAGSPTTFKQLGIQRAFVIYLQNRTADRKFFRMTIVDSAAANGSFLQRGADLNVRDVEIFPLSSVTDTVFVTGTASSSQPVRVDVVEINRQGGTIVAGGDTATVLFNSDASNPSLDVADPSSETHTPKLFTPGNKNSSLPKISNPQLANPQLANPQLANPQLANPQLANPQLANLQLTNSPYADPAGDVIRNVTNYTWQITNAGSTASAFTPVFNIANQAALAGKKTTLYIYNTYKVPAFVQTAAGCQAIEQPRDVIISAIANPQLANPQLANPQLANPQLANPQLANSTFYIAPSDRSASAVGTAASAQRNLLQNVAFQAPAPGSDLTITIPAPDTFITLSIQDGDTFQVGPPPPPPAPGEPPPPSNPPLTLDDFKGGGSAIGVVSTAAPVIAGVVQPIVESVSSSADLVFSSIPTITPPSLQAGGLVTVSSFNVTVVGNTSTAASGFRYGFYLSPTVEINPATAVFLGSLTHEGAIAPGQIVTLSGGTFAIPPATTPGQYYVGVFLNDGQQYTPALTPFLFESFANNTASIALTIAAPVGPAPTAASDVGTTNEDVTLNVAAPGVLGNDGNAGPVTAVLSLGASHGTVTLNANGSYSYVPNGNYFGPDSFTYYATNGTLASPLATVSITVAAVNDPPSFVKGGDQTSPANTIVSVPAWASQISAGPNESQALNFIVTPTNGSLFTVAPAVSPSGTLTYTTGNTGGTTSVTVALHDNGGGLDTSAAQVFNITVQPPPGTDLRITQQRTPDSPTAGDTVTYTVTVDNLAGPADNVFVSDAYPAGLTWVSVLPSAGTCGPGDLGNQCNLGTIASGGSVTIQMVYEATTPGPVTHNVVVSTSTTDLVPGNNTASDHGVVLARTSFQGPSVTSVGGFSSGIVAIADFNEDGVPDVVVTDGLSSDTISLVLGGTSTPIHFATGVDPTGVSTGDFNHDGHDDLVVANFGSSTISVLLGNGSGGFAPAANIAVPTNPFSTEVGDFNEDGNVDVVIGYTGTANDSVQVLLGDGVGGFSGPTPFSSGQAPTNVIVADFDGDDHLDIAVPNTGTNTISVLKGDGHGAFPTRSTFVLPETVQRLRYLGDVNNDGRPDLGVTIGSPSSLVLLKNLGGTFDVPQEIIGHVNVGFAIGADFNNDGNGDVVAINPTQGRVLVLSGDGTGGFATTSYVTNTNLNHLAVGDLNNDDCSDIVGSSRGLFYTLLNTCGAPQQSDLVLSASATGSVINGSTYSVHADVTNQGPGVATQARVTLAVPPGLTFVGISGAGTCSELNGTVICDAGALNPGASASFTLDVTAYASGSRSVSVGATSATTELHPADNFAQATTTVGAGSQSFTVTTAADLGPGSLRQAITDANLNPGFDTIRFSIPGPGAHTIALKSSLPNISDPVLIDGTTQPGYAGTPLLVVDGFATENPSTGFVVNADGSTIRGLQVQRFAFTGIAINSSNNVVGGTVAGAGNVIVNNIGRGVGVNSGTGNAIRHNSISGNGQQGIELGANGDTPNDPGDADTGANNLQNFPVLTGSQVVGGITTIAGTLNSAAGTAFGIDLFSSAACDPSGVGEGEQYLGSLTATTDPAGNASFSTTAFSVPIGRFITATATDPSGNTSEFSACRQVVTGLVVSSVDNPGLKIESGTSGSGFILLDAHHDGGPVPQLLATADFGPAGKPNLTLPGVMAVLPAAAGEPAIGYFVAGGRIGILDLATNQVTGAIRVNGDPSPTIVRANPTTRFAYFVAGNRLFAIDGRSAQPTYNQVVLSTMLGSQIRALALNESSGKLYVISNTFGIPTTFSSSQVTAIDVNPAHTATFHKVLGSGAISVANTNVTDAVVNPATDKIYVGDTSSLRVVNGTTLVSTQILNVPSAFSIAVNPLKNVVYVSNGFSNITVIDGATDTRITAFTLPTTGGPSQTGEGRMVIHHASGRVFYHYADGPRSSRITVLDGDPTHVTPNPNTFNTVLDTIDTGWETNASYMAIDQAADRVVLYNNHTRMALVFNALTDAVVANPVATQASIRPLALDLTTHKAYASLFSGAIFAVDLNTGASQLIHTGTETRAPIVDKTSHLAYVPRTGANTGVNVVNATGLVTTITPPAGAGILRFAERDTTTNRIYVGNFGGNAAGDQDPAPGAVTVINGNDKSIVTNVTVGNRPTALAVDEVLKKVYVGNTAVLNDVSANYHTWAGVTVIDSVTNAATPANLDGIAPNALSIAGVLVNPVTGRVYLRITGGTTATMGYYEPSTNTAVALPASLGPVAVMKVNPNPLLNRIYLGSTDNKVHVLDGATHAELATLSIGGSGVSSLGTLQSWIAINKTTGRFYVADRDAETLWVIDGQTNTEVTHIAGLERPIAVAVNEVQNRVYVLDSDDTLLVIDGVTNRILQSIQLPFNPIALAVDDNITPAQIYVSGDCPGASGCVDTNSGVMVVSDPVDPNGPITLSALGPAAHGTVTLNANGSLSYSSNAGFVGVDQFSFTVTDTHGASATGTINLYVVTVPHLTTTTLAAGRLGQPYSQSLTVSGGTPPYRWSISGGQLPPGLVLDEVTGVISGVPSVNGTYSVGVQVADDSEGDGGTFPIVIGPITITSVFPNPTFNTPYSNQMVAGGNTGPVTWSLNTQNSPLLSWLSLSPTGVLSGTPPTYGALPQFAITATDTANNETNTRLINFNVGGPLDVIPTTLREGVVLETNQPSLPIVGGSGTKTVTLTGGSLPPGITMTSTGAFNGVATNHGTFNFTVQVQDATATISRNITWRVSAREQQGNTGAAGNITFGGSGGRKLAQTFTVGAWGKLTGIGSFNIACTLQGPVTVQIQHLTPAGLPDGVTLATGVSTGLFGAIAVSPALNVTIDEKMAFVLSSPTPCTVSNAPAVDSYQAGDAFADSGSGWVPLALTADARYDLPFRTLLLPAVPLGYLNTGRNNGSRGVTLNNGTILFTGPGVTAEIYNPTTRLSALTAGNMNVSRTQHTATLLANGRVLIAGGRDSANNFLDSAEIFDPSTGLFTATGSLGTARSDMTATLLANGKVLIAGGNTQIGPISAAIASTELYDSVAGTFSPGPSMAGSRYVHTATVLNSGKILMAGGFGAGTSAELYDPSTNTFAVTLGGMEQTRGTAQAALLNDGRVLIVGGQANDVQPTAEIYDPAAVTAADAFTFTGSMSVPRQNHAIANLTDGSVLVAGGFAEVGVNNYVLPIATIERWMPASGTFVKAGSMVARRQGALSFTPSANTILWAGGSSQSWLTTNAIESFNLAATPHLNTSALPDGQVGVDYGLVTLTASGGSGSGYQINRISGALPPGMNYSGNTLSGTPGAAGVYTLGFEVVDSLFQGNQQSLTLRVGALTINSPYRLTDGALNHSYTLQLTASSAATWSLPAAASANMPPGLSLSPSGLISGTPNTLGYYNFVVRAVDASGLAALKTLSINILNPMVITTSTLPEAVLWDSYNRCINTSNSIGTRTFSVVSGSLPAGISLQTNGCFSGTVSALGTSTFSVQVTDSASPPQQTVPFAYTVRASAPDASFSASSATNPQPIGQTSQRSVARTFTLGPSGVITAAQAFGLSCAASNPTIQLSARLYRASPLTGEPLTLLAVNSGDWFDPIIFAPTVTAGQGEQYVVEFLIPAADCTIATPTTQTWMSGDSWEKVGNGAWQRMVGFDVPFRMMTSPLQPFSSMATWRGGVAAAPAATNKILIAGGNNVNSAELYDRVANTLTATGNMTVARTNHVATQIGGGKVLITGGTDSNGNSLATAEVFNPASGTNGAFTATGNTMSVARQQHTATLLSDGRVLIVGGFNGGGGVAAVDIYDPASNLFTAVAPMGASRWAHTATLLPGDTRVLIVGGNTNGPFPVPNGVIYDPATNSYTSTAEPIVALRSRHVAIPLTSGRVLVAGGTRFYPALEPVAQIYNPITNSLETGPTMSFPRMDAQVVGDVIFGGTASDAMGQQGVSEVERYNAATNQFEFAGNLMIKRYGHAAVSLGGGRSILIGGYGSSTLPGRTVETYGPTPVPTLQPAIAPDGQDGQPYGPFTSNTNGTSPFTLSSYSNVMPDGTGIFFNMSGSNALGFTISGSSNGAGSFPFNLLIGDSLGAQRTQAFRVRIDPIIVTTTQLPPGTNGASYGNQQIQATSLHGPLTFKIVTNSGAEVTTGGGLPNGLSLSSSGIVSGTPTQSGFFTFNVRVTDQLKQSVLTLVSIFIP